MPKCLNHSKATYKGTEPSPKGLGYCARVGKVGTEMQGRDGRIWVIRANKAGTKQWKPLSGTLTPLPKTHDIVSLAPLRFRMVIGYYRNEKKYAKKHSHFTDKSNARPFATKKSLSTFARSATMWENMYIAYEGYPLFDGYKAYNVRLGHITPKHINKIVVLDGPIHDMNVWEKLFGISWYKKPDLVLVVDVTNVPVVRVQESDAKAYQPHLTGMKPIDAKFYQDLQRTLNHFMMSAEGWINHSGRNTDKGVKWTESEPFKGQLRLVQIGTNLLPNYHQFQ